MTLASLGSLGKYPSNIERDLFRRNRRQMGLSVELYAVEVPSSHRSGQTTVDVLISHELWAWLWRVYPSQAKATFVGQDSDLVELWKKTLDRNPRKLENPVL